MRERVGHGEVGRRGAAWGPGWSPGWSAEERRGVERTGRRRPGPGPRPTRPAVAPVAVRPREVPRPVLGLGGAASGRSAEAWCDGAGGLRLLARRPVAVRRGARYRLRRAVAGLAVLVASAAVVVALGLLARVAGPESAVPGPVPSAPAVVTAAPGETVWEVAARLAPGRPGPEVAALAERLVAENDLTSARLRPGQVLRVVAG
jgi:hypothetical protein